MYKYNPSSGSGSGSSSSSSSHGLVGPSGGGGLVRNDSAPASLLTTTGSHRHFSSETSSLTTCKTSTDRREAQAISGLQSSSYVAFGEFAAATGGRASSSLVRHSSSPADFLNRMATTVTAPDNGFSVTRGRGSYNSRGCSDGVHKISRLNSQLSFTKDSLSQITEESENVVDDICADDHRKAANSYATASFGMESWDDTNAIMFAAPPSKRAKSVSGDIVKGLSIIDTQFQFGLLQTNLDMATMENLIEIPQDSVPCKIRAKRGCATHPRSIAERERRTRISGKLKKLQDLVPNMDKQTSYADMLDLAVQHIKGLQTQLQNLNEELENCTCGCKKST